MYSKKFILDIAFRDAIEKCQKKGMAESLNEAAIADFVRAYAKREGFFFTEAEIHSTIIADVETMNNSGEKLHLKNPGDA